MANGILPVDFRDDILSEDMNNRRRYQMITNSDGTVSFEDVTKYDQVGSNFGQAQINATNKAVNGLADSIGDAFSEEKTYAVGEYAIYDNALYEFTAAKAAGPWDPDVAALTTIADALSELNGNLTAVSDNVSQKAGKTSNSYTGTQTVRKNVGIAASTFKTAHFVARNGNNASSRASYGFENEGVNGGALYLDTDGLLKFVDNTGIAHTLSWQ